ncbi:MAG TPA: SDR family oxidoreductase [Candidatus Dormibacteraeota bacterium]|nr:SDR family oxidoreductase [Candidatus Dormibacteraeota bacterium]
MDLGLKGRNALVTAASKGLGRACAEALVGEGAEVFISSRDPIAIEKTGKEIKAAGWLAADMSTPGDPEALVKAAITRFTDLDVLVVNAGGPPPGTFQTTPLEMWEVAFQLTLMSAVRLIRAGLPHLKRSDQGRIVCITSISVRQPIPNIALSNSLRAAVTGLAKTLSRELAHDRITVNCLAPDAILTDRIREMAAMTGADAEARIKEMAAGHPMGRMGDPAEFGATCAFICSKQAGFITGQTIGIDGGALMGVH